jgi:hypothetical protein
MGFMRENMKEKKEKTGLIKGDFSNKQRCK